MEEQDLALDDRREGDTSPAPSGTPGGKEDYYRNLIEFVADAIVTIDETGTVEIFNHAAEELFGYAKNEVVGKNIEMLMPPPYADEHDGYLATYMRTGEAKIIGTWRETTGRQKNGTNIPIEIGIREFESKGGVGRRFAGIVRDLRALKRAQDEIERKNRDILELSTPVISVWDKVLVLPLVGTLDSNRVQHCVEKTLDRLAEDQAMVCIIDITNATAGNVITESGQSNRTFRLDGGMPGKRLRVQPLKFLVQIP